MLKLPADQRRGTGVRPRSEPQISGRTHLVVGCGFVPVPRTALHGRSCDEIALAALPHRRQTTDVAVSQSPAFGCRHRTTRRASHVYRHSTPVVARVEKDLRPEDCSMDAQGRRSSEEMWRRRPDLNRGWRSAPQARDRASSSHGSVRVQDRGPATRSTCSCEAGRDSTSNAAVSSLVASHGRHGRRPAVNGNLRDSRAPIVTTTLRRPCANRT